VKLLQQLLNESKGAPFVQTQPEKVEIFDRPLGNELFQLLSLRNGTFLFEQSLRLFPTEDCPSSYGLVSWNSSLLWRSTYRNLPSDLFCFAEDLFGNQFGLLNNEIVLFHCETAEIERFAFSFEELAGRLILDPDYLTGRSLAAAWCYEFRALPARNRLVGRTPFVLGGEYSVQNLVSVESAKAMRIRGPLASKISNVPDGTRITLEIE
jgi:hypothetical protein